MNIHEIAECIRNYKGLTRKREIPFITKAMGALAPRGVLDEDGVAIRDGSSYLVVACDAIQTTLCRAAPRFAGRSAVFASVNDVAAMGGKPLVIVNALGAENESMLYEMLDGMAEAAAIFGLTVDGGHLMPMGSEASITVTVVGRAKRPLKSTTLKPGHLILLVTDLVGTRPKDWRFAWNTTTGKSNRQIRGRYTTLRKMAEEGFLTAGKDVSNAGILGTIAILLETSGVGGAIDLNAIHVPNGIPPEDWYRTFLSFGFVLGVQKKNALAVMTRFRRHGLFANIVGQATKDRQVILKQGDQRAVLFDWQHDTILR